MTEPNTKRARIEPEDVDVFIAQIKGYIQPAPIIFYGGTTRRVAAEHKFIRIPMNGSPPQIKSKASDYLLQKKWLTSAEHMAGKPFPTLDNAMVNNWQDNPPFVDFLLGHPAILSIFKAIFGDDFCLVIERFCQQTKPKENLKTLQLTCHVDAPVWAKSSPSELPAITSIPRRDNEIVVIVIDQAKPHGIPVSGNSKGVFVGALTPAQHQAYETATMAHLRRPLAARPQYWPALRDLGSFAEVTAANLLCGGRPPIFPKFKVIAMPAGYNGSRYKHFAGYFPPEERRYSTADVLARIQHKHGDGIAKPFTSAIQRLQQQHCAKDPSLLSTDVMRRFFRISEP